MYTLQVSESSAFNILVVNANIDSVTEYNFSAGDLDYGIKYYWRVKSIDEMTGKESAWSNICWFLTRHEDQKIYQLGTTSGGGAYIMYIPGITRFGTVIIPQGEINISSCCGTTAIPKGEIDGGCAIYSSNCCVQKSVFFD